MNIHLFLAILIVRCSCDEPYLLQGFPSDSTVEAQPFLAGPCKTLVNAFDFLTKTDEASLNSTACTHQSDKSLVVCKLGLKIDPSFDFKQYADNDPKVLIIFVQEFAMNAIRNRVIDLCFIDLFSGSVKEIAFCGYRPPLTIKPNISYLHILDVPTLAAVAPNIETLFISGVNIWQSIELRQFTSLKHLLIAQGQTIGMQYYHTPYCADCEGAHPLTGWSFHYLLGLHSQLDYFLFDSSIPSESCAFDLLKKVQESSSPIPRLVIASHHYQSDVNQPICNKCTSGLCPLLAVCLDEKTDDRRKKDDPFECLCVEEVNVDDEFISCDPMTMHLPIYSTRCGHQPSIFKFLSLPIYSLASYLLASLIAFTVSTIVLIKLR